ncbi:MAG: GNAT family N-acetyltransferase [Thermoplasmata archaeon]|nr:GNAT family N-acetyltransferase [Thermoplasmata archaeon]
MIRLVPMTAQQFDRFVAESVELYAADHVREGAWTAADAPAHARAELERLLPKGVETPDHVLRVVHEEATGERVGDVWFAFQQSDGSPQIFVFWIGIDEKYRRRGFASAVFAELEREARERGARRVALHVFGHNVDAQAFYAKLGYTPRNIIMAKPV